MAITERIRRALTAWNAFTSVENPMAQDYSTGFVSSYSGTSPAQPALRYTNEKSIVSAIYTRMGVDIASIVFRHVEVDDQDRYVRDMDTRLNECLTFQSNIDQTPRDFRQDLALTLFDHGVAAVVAVDTGVDPATGEVLDIYNLRVGTIVKWMPKKVRISLYNEDKGERQEVTLNKSDVAIVQNPLYNVMNAPNSTLQRLMRKLNLLDTVDEQSSSGKLDVIIQLPYTIKSEARREQAEKRRKDIEFQLKGSQYGIAYTDGVEKITQLNRPAENNLLTQIESLTESLYGYLGITKAVMLGTAPEAEMINYFNRTVEPIADAVQEAMQVAFIKRVGMKKKQRIMYFKDLFKIIPMSELAEIADKFTRNEILSPNEIRGIVGKPPSSDPKADELRNSNMPQGAPAAPPAPPGPSFEEMDAIMKETFDGLQKDIDELTKQAGNG